VFLFHEIHVDDFRLDVQRDRATYEASLRLLEALVGVAEARGLKLALRFRHPFAKAARRFEGVDNALVRFEERGHELGVHAHHRRIHGTWHALRDAGVKDLRAVVPGFIQGDRGDLRRVLNACRGLGFRWCTDQCQTNAFPYAGLTPWRPAPDFSGPGTGPLVFVDVSVNPFAWGLLRWTGERTEQTFGLRDEHFHRLVGLLDAHLRHPRPHAVTHFGCVFHEHQHVTGPDSLDIDEESLAAWDRFLGEVARRPVDQVLPGRIVEAWEAVEGTGGDQPPRLPGRAFSRVDPLGLRHDVPSWVRAKLPRPAMPPAVRRARNRVAWERRRPVATRSAATAEQVRVPVGEGFVEALRWGEGGFPLVLSHAGHFGGNTDQLRLFGLTPDQVVEAGFEVWTWDRSGTGLSRGREDLAPGNLRHVREAVAVWQAASASRPAGWLCYSAGLVPVLLALPEIRPAFVVDAEAPADRLSMQAGDPAANPFFQERSFRAGLDDEAWAWREPWRLVGALEAPYHRLQAEVDHQHGRCVLHARVLLDAAAQPFVNGAPYTGQVLGWPGRLAEHGGRVLEVLTAARRAG